MNRLLRLLLCFFIVGGFHITSVGELRLTDGLQAQSKKKKRSSKSKKKRPSKKKSSKGKKRSSKGKKKRSSKKKSSKKKESVSQVSNTPIIKKGPKINVAAYADELFQLTGELQASNKEMANATRYIYTDKFAKKTKRVESLPFLTIIFIYNVSSGFTMKLRAIGKVLKIFI